MGNPLEFGGASVDLMGLHRGAPEGLRGVSEGLRNPMAPRGGGNVKPFGQKSLGSALSQSGLRDMGR